MPGNKYVILLKSQKSDKTEDKYEVILNASGYAVNQVTTLDFNYINLEKLQQKLLQANNYSGLIFSSPRCVEAVKLALNGADLANEWKLKDNYVVGEATYQLAWEKLNLMCLGKESGNSNKLSEVILKEKDKYSKSFLYPHGDLKMDTMKTKFSNSNICIDEILVYETILNMNIEEEFKEATNTFSNLPQYIVFFSPSGVKAMKQTLKVLPLQSIKIIAIGTTTESALLNSGINVFATAEKPTAQDLLNILLIDQ